MIVDSPTIKPVMRISDDVFISDSRRLQAIYAVHSVLNQVESDHLDIQALLARIVEVAVKQLNANEGTLIIVNQDMEVEYSWLVSQEAASLLSTIIDRGLGGRVIRTQEAAVIDDTRTDERWLLNPHHITSREPWSVVCVPIINRSRTIGAATLHKAGISQFGPSDVDLLTTIANQVASFIENARLFEQSQRQLQISALLHEASRVINSTLNIAEIMQLLLAQMNELLNAEAISIALVDQQTNELVYRVAEGIGSEKIVGLRMPSNQGLSGWVMEHGQPVLVSNAVTDPRFNPEGDERTGYETRAMICAPMQFKGQVLGTIQAINPNEGSFVDQDLNLLVNLANIASSAIANAQQFAQTQAAEARYTNLFQDSIDPIILTDIDGQIVEANRQAISFFGYSREELLGRSVNELHSVETKLPRMRTIPTKGVRQFTSRALPKQSSQIPVEVYAKRTQFGPHELLQWIYHDISKQIELEQMREDLIAMLFHDLQSPLGNVISSLELMKYELPLDSDPALHSMLDIAARSSNRLQTLIRSLLDINRLEAGHPVSELQEVHAAQLVQNVWEIEEPNFERRRVKLNCDIQENLPLIYVEEDMIRRVLVNLVDNALKYSSEGDCITITAHHGWNNDENKVLLSVSDQGTGIAPQYRKSVFDKFRRVDTQLPSKGLGLGLAFCRLAVEAHGGRIWVDDAPDGGARFNLTLPVASDALGSSNQRVQAGHLAS
jgi:two-component system, NtrC family, sensor histidine kinase KinB